MYYINITFKLNGVIAQSLVYIFKRAVCPKPQACETRGRAGDRQNPERNSPSFTGA